MTSVTPTLPARLGRYELVDHIATGGMAEVFLARSVGVQGFRKHVVVKRLRAGLATAPGYVQLFVQEARISASLVHPNIVQIHELGAAPGPGGDVHYIVMEYIHGADLTRVRRALTAQGRRMPVALAVTCAVRVLRALAYAHERVDSTGRPLGLVHRDVSPHNVLVSFQGEVKLVDFGIARVEGEALGGALPGGGKYAYMSPEQARGEALDGRSDVYSTGILLWELLAGRRLFQHPDAAEKLRRVQQAEVPDPSEHNPEVPASLSAALRRMLARDPALRPTAAQAEEALLTVLFDEGMRADGVHLGGLVRGLFPELARRDPGGLDLEGLAADLLHLDPSPAADALRRAAGEEEGTGTMTGSAPGGSHPGGSQLGGTGPGGTESVLLDPDEADDADQDGLPALRGLAPGERKPVVVVVVEVSGFTEPSALIDPELIARSHYRLLRRVRHVADRHHGRLDRFHDDRFTIFFGLPRTTEHDVDRSLACAAQLVRESRRLQRRGMSVALSVGVHAGELAVGRLGSRGGRGLRYLSRGDTTKLSLRLSQAADLDQILVSDEVMALARPRFVFAPGPPVRRRGEEHPARSWRLVGRETGVGDSAGRWLPRGEELEVLGRALRRVASGERVVVAISGPAGVGKSRLLQELRDLARARGVPVYSARAVPYTVDRPLATLRDIVARVMGLPDEADPALVSQGLAHLGALGLPPADLDIIGALFAANPSRLRGAGQTELLRAAGRFVRALASTGPVLLAVEDAQHLSEIEQHVLLHILTVTADVPVLLLLTVRGSVPRGLGGIDERIVLGALAPDMQEALAAHLLGARHLGPELADLVRRSAEGNPRYVVALVTALCNAGRVRVEPDTACLQGEGEIPGLKGGLHGLVTARVDALTAPARQALQVAAMMGARFPRALLAEAIGPDDLGPALGELLERGLLVAEGEGLAFQSDLVWEVSQRTVLAGRRRELHGLVAAALSRHLGAQGPHLADLAEHLAAAGHLLEAARTGYLAGQQLRRQQLLGPAVRLWDQASTWLVQAVEAGEDPGACLRGEALLHRRLGEARGLLGETEVAERHLRAALDAAGECADHETEARAILDLGQLYASRGDVLRARTHLEAARDAALAVGARTPWQRNVAVGALEGLGGLALEAGQAEDARAHLDAALDLAADDPVLAARALVGLAGLPLRAGDEGAAMDLLGRARELVLQADDRILLGRVIAYTGLVHLGAKRPRAALSCFEEARELRRDTGFREGEARVLQHMGRALVALGTPGRAWAAFERSRDLSRAIGWARGVACGEVWMAALQLQRAGDEPGPTGAGEGDHTEGAAPDSPETRAEGEAALYRALDPAQAVGAREAWLDGALLLAGQLVRVGRREAALSLLARAEAEARDLGDRVRQGTLARAALAAGDGHDEAAGG